MSTLSVVILQSGETDSLRLRLHEVADADEIIILEDATKVSADVHKLALQYKAQAVARNLNSDFSDHRNFALKRVSKTWTLFIDSDESVSADLWQEIRLATQQESVLGYWIPRRDIFLGQLLKYGETGSMQLLRLAQTKAGVWQERVHETWNVPEPHGFLKESLIHNPNTTIAEFLQKIHRYASLVPEDRTPLSRRKVLFELCTYPVGKFLQAMILRSGWRDGVRGVIHAFVMSYHSLLVRVYCWEAWYGKSRT